MQVLDGDDASSSSGDSDFGDKVRQAALHTHVLVSAVHMQLQWSRPWPGGSLLFWTDA